MPERSLKIAKNHSQNMRKHCRIREPIFYLLISRKRAIISAWMFQETTVELKIRIIQEKWRGRSEQMKWR